MIYIKIQLKFQYLPITSSTHPYPWFGVANDLDLKLAGVSRLCSHVLEE